MKIELGLDILSISNLLFIVICTIVCTTYYCTTVQSIWIASDNPSIMRLHHGSLGRILNAAAVGKLSQIRSIIHKNDDDGPHSTTHNSEGKINQENHIKTRGALENSPHVHSLGWNDRPFNGREGWRSYGSEELQLTNKMSLLECVARSFSMSFVHARSTFLWLVSSAADVNDPPTDHPL